MPLHLSTAMHWIVWEGHPPDWRSKWETMPLAMLSVLFEMVGGERSSPRHAWRDLSHTTTTTTPPASCRLSRGQMQGAPNPRGVLLHSPSLPFTPLPATPIIMHLCGEWSLLHRTSPNTGARWMVPETELIRVAGEKQLGYAASNNSKFPLGLPRSFAPPRRSCTQRTLAIIR